MPAATPGSDAARIEVSLEAEGWRVLADPEAFAARAASAALAAAGLGGLDAELSLLLADDARAAELNAAFRGLAKPTNVLSWPSVERAEPADAESLGPAPFLGDIAVAIETLQREAEMYGRALEHHAAHLIVHGVLHLIGYDHQDEESAARMEAVEDDALSRLGLPGRDA